MARSTSPLIVGIAGGSGSGKTTLADRIVEGLPVAAVTVIRHDHYYRDHPELNDEERARINFDHPEALETSLLVEHLQQLKMGRRVRQPLYDFTRHRRSEESVELDVGSVVIVEGILTFVDPRLREFLDIKIYVDTDADIRVIRRIRRDMEQRGRSFDSVRDQYYATVRPMHQLFVEPSRRHADLIIPEGGDNRVALELLLARLREVIPQN
jgi:uridine kinase